MVLELLRFTTFFQTLPMSQAAFSILYALPHRTVLKIIGKCYFFHLADRKRSLEAKLRVENSIALRTQVKHPSVRKFNFNYTKRNDEITNTRCLC